MTVPAGTGYDLNDLKTHVGIDLDDSSSDGALTLVLRTAESMVREWSSESAAAEKPELVTVHNGQAVLSRYPVTAVAGVGVVNASNYNVTAVADLTPYPVIDADAGIVRAPWANGTRLSVTYTAGVAEPSDQFAYAVLEAAAHLWRARQGGSETYLPAGEPDVAGPPLLGGLKKRVLLILGDKAKGPTVA